MGVIMKKKNIVYIVIAALALIAVILAVVFTFKSKDNKNIENNSVTTNEFTELNEITSELESEVPETEVTGSVQVNKPSRKPTSPNKPVQSDDSKIDGWLKILSVGDYGGKLSFTIENASKDDIEYAIISCSTGEYTVSFKVTALMAGQKALIICTEDEAYNKNTNYNNWKVENKILYSEKPSLCNDVFNISTEDGAVTVKNISNKNINGTIYIYYKRVDNGVYIAPETYRTKIDGLKKGESKTTSAAHFTKGVHEIIFIDYEK